MTYAANFGQGQSLLVAVAYVGSQRHCAIAETSSPVEVTVHFAVVLRVTASTGTTLLEGCRVLQSWYVLSTSFSHARTLPLCNRVG